MLFEMFKSLFSKRTQSEYYRKNKRNIINGIVPEKYTRLIPFITGNKVIEMGSAEGVLALCLAKEGKKVTAIERNPHRYRDALKLQKKWLSKKLDVGSCAFVCTSIQERPELLIGQDTFLASRVIYYLGDQINPLFDSISKHVKEVVLCGNESRARRYEEKKVDLSLKDNVYYATIAGMKELLVNRGYEITSEIHELDPIVVGRKVI